MLKDIITHEQCEQLSALIKESETIVCVCHRSPDGDALGACLGWAEFLRTVYGKECEIIIPDQYPDYLQWMPNTEKVVRFDKHQEGCTWTLAHADLVFCLDFNTVSRVGDMQAALEQSKARRVLIDHHLAPDVPAVLSISHPEASSTCELVFRVVWQMGGFEKTDKHFAAPIYCGMMTDTGGFTFNSNDPDIFFIISQLLTKHINKDKIYRNVYHNFRESRLRLMGYVMYEKLVVMPDLHASFFTLTRQDLKRFKFIKGDAEGLVNLPLQIKGHKLSISLREDTEKEKQIWVSTRSVDDFPCNKLCELFFNGGGHLNASGGQLHCTMDEAVEQVKRALLHFEDLLKR